MRRAARLRSNSSPHRSTGSAPGSRPLEKAQELPIGYFVFVDQKRRHGHGVFLEFVVPAERAILAAPEAQVAVPCGIVID